MLVSISGSQGSGKSWILNEIENLGFNIIKRKTARAILLDWGVTLNDVDDDLDLRVKLQEEISKRKFEDEIEAANSNDLVFTERTHADLFTYALVSLGKNNDYEKWLINYYKICMQYNQQLYSLVYYLRAGHFNVVNDGVRGANIHYSRMVDLVMLDITQQMVHTSKLTVIETPDLEQRVNIITAQSNQFYYELFENQWDK
jgi:hypothetical protein